MSRTSIVDQERKGDEDIEQAAGLATGPRDAPIPAPIEDVVRDEQQEHRGPDHLVHDIPQPPIREAHEQKAGCQAIEEQPKDEDTAHNTLPWNHSIGVPSKRGMRYPVNRYSLSAWLRWQDWQRAVFSLVLIVRSGQNHWNCQSPVRRRSS